MTVKVRAERKTMWKEIQIIDCSYHTDISQRSLKIKLKPGITTDVRVCCVCAEGTLYGRVKQWVLFVRAKLIGVGQGPCGELMQVCLFSLMSSG